MFPRQVQMTAGVNPSGWRPVRNTPPLTGTCLPYAGFSSIMGGHIAVCRGMRQSCLAPGPVYGTMVRVWKVKGGCNRQ